jgi:threonine 3-dehydrogenase
VSQVAIGDRVALETHIFCSRCAACRRGQAHVCERLRVLGFSWDGGFADFTRVPESICVPLPDSVSPRNAALLEPLGVAVHALQRAGLELVPGAAVLITGCGPIGLLLAEVALRLGASKVVCVEPDPYRRGLAERLGALVVAPVEGDVAAWIEELGNGPGFDLGFEVSGAPGALSFLLDAARPEAIVVTVGEASAPAAVDVTTSLNHRGLQLRGVFGRRLWETWDLALKLVAEQGFDPGWLVTHRFPLAAVDQAMEAMRSGAGKVQLLPSLAAPA